MAKVYLAVGSVSGTAEKVALASANHLKQYGYEVCWDKRAQVDRVIDSGAGALLIVTSTTGMGELPFSLKSFFDGLKTPLSLPRLSHVGIICLGDSAYRRTFCGAGDLLESALAGREAIGDVMRLNIDASQEETPEVVAISWLTSWSNQLGA